MGIFSELVDDFKHLPPAGKFAVALGGGAVVIFAATRIPSLGSGSGSGTSSTTPTVGTGSSGGLGPDSFTPPDAVSGGGFDPGSIYSPPPVIPATSSAIQNLLNGGGARDLVRSKPSGQDLLNQGAREKSSTVSTVKSVSTAPVAAALPSLRSLTGSRVF